MPNHARLLPIVWTAFCLALSGMALGLFPVRAEALSFSKPQRLATLPWCKGSHPGVSTGGVEWMVVDNRGRYWLESDLDFGLYSSNGHYLQTVSPLDKLRNFYGFAAMEALGDGRVLLLERMESLLEQREKDNFELRSKPGARLVVLQANGKVKSEKEEVDPVEPHSDYYLENGGIYAIHDDGTYSLLDNLGSGVKDGFFENFAAVAFSPTRWNGHVKVLPVFRAESRVTHDAKGNPRVEKDAKFFLMGQPFVEGTAPLAERVGKIYYQVVCYKSNSDFIDSVFVEDSVQKKYALVDLIVPDKNLGVAHDHALFVDRKGNLFEGVAKSDGYRIYEWKTPD